MEMIPRFLVYPLRCFKITLIHVYREGKEYLRKSAVNHFRGNQHQAELT